jgi:hypothetical protein
MGNEGIPKGEKNRAIQRKLVEKSAVFCGNGGSWRVVLADRFYQSGSSRQLGIWTV